MGWRVKAFVNRGKCEESTDDLESEKRWVKGMG